MGVALHPIEPQHCPPLRCQASESAGNIPRHLRTAAVGGNLVVYQYFHLGIAAAMTAQVQQGGVDKYPPRPPPKRRFKAKLTNVLHQAQHAVLKNILCLLGTFAKPVRQAVHGLFKKAVNFKQSLPVTCLGTPDKLFVYIHRKSAFHTCHRYRRGQKGHNFFIISRNGHCAQPTPCRRQHATRHKQPGFRYNSGHFINL